MPPIQTTYADRQRAGRPGLVVNMETANSITRINESASGVLGFGHACFQGVSDKGCLIVGGVALEAASAARAGNTGNGLLTAAPAVSGLAAEGTYTLVADEPGADGGVFRMEDPDGEFLGTVRVGVPATLGGIGPFTIADGAADFVAGDAFEIEVSSEEGASVFRGVTIEDPTLVRREGETVDTFRKGDNVALLTAGVIWVTAGAAVRAGDQAAFDPATKRYVTDGGIPLPNCSFDSSAGNGEDVKLRVSHL